jgi:hypothetical protein
VVPLDDFAALLVRHLFPKLLAVLARWLVSGPDCDELLRWYEGWAAVLPAPVRAHPAVDRQYCAALRLIDVALESDATGGTPDIAAALLYATQQQQQQQGSAGDAPVVDNAARAPAEAPLPVHPSGRLHLRELLQRLALQRGLLFAPKPGPARDGKSLYSLGSVTVYLDQDVVFVRGKDGRFLPAAVDEALRAAEAAP